MSDTHTACAVIETTADKLEVGQVLIVGEGIAYEIIEIDHPLQARDVLVWCRHMKYPFMLAEYTPVQAYSY